MNLDVICPNCSRKLRVPVTETTQSARCPSCNALFDVTGTGATPTGDSPKANPPSGWLIRIPEGLDYGPVSWEILQRWMAENRVTAECQIRQEGSSAWLPADTVFPQLQRAVPRPAPVSEVAYPNPLGTGSGAARTFPRAVALRPEPHRGALVLALGILSWVSCPLFGMFAWILGNADLKRMDVGRMDSAGREVTQVGRILGMIHVLLMLAVFAILVPLFVLMGIVLH